MRSASVSFVFTQSWSLSPAHAGKLQHVLRDLLAKLASGALRAPPVAKRFPLDKIRAAHRELALPAGKVVLTL